MCVTGSRHSVRPRAGRTRIDGYFLGLTAAGQVSRGSPGGPWIGTGGAASTSSWTKHIADDPPAAAGAASRPPGPGLRSGLPAPPAASGGRRCSPRCTATSTPCSAGTRTRKLLTAAVLQAEHLETGCCGLAGNFGFQVGHGGRPRPRPSRTNRRPAARPATPDGQGRRPGRNRRRPGRRRGDSGRLLAATPNNDYAVTHMVVNGNPSLGHALEVTAGSSIDATVVLVSGQAVVQGTAKREGKAAAGAMM